jgi:hypothetical protein
MGTGKFLKASVKYSLVLGMFVFLLVGFFGLSHNNMATSSDGQMSSGNCFMPGMTEVLCQMNSLEHIAAWQNMFTAVPSQNDILLLLASLLTLALGALFTTHHSTAPPKTLVSQTSFVYYKRYVPVLDPLQEAFSNGILHPKIF